MDPTTTKRFRSEEEDLDFISKLPDELLRLIISRLSLKGAARATVLSRRWASALDMFSGDLVFGMAFLGHNDHLSEPESKPRFVSLVNKILFNSLRSSPTFRLLKVGFEHCPDSAPDLDNWLLFALSKRVESLRLNLSPQWITPKIPYCFPLHLFRQSTFTSLKFLRFEYVAVSEEVIHWILNHCPNLERLRLGRGCLTDLLSLRVSVPSLTNNNKLTCLELYCNESDDTNKLRNLEISPGTLVSLDMTGPRPSRTRFFLEKMTPSLVHMGFGGYLGCHLIKYPTQYSSILTKLKSLKLTTRRRRWNYELLQLNNLQHLVLHLFMGSLQLWASFLKGAPSLQRLVIKFKMTGPYTEPETSRELEKVKEKSPYKELKEVEIYGFNGDIRLREFIFYLIENSSSLGKIVVYTFNEPHEGVPSYPEDWEARRGSALHLKSQLPATLKFYYY